MTTDISVEVDGKALQLRKDRKHDWVMPTKDVAAGYGVSEAAIRNHKERHADELLEGKHWGVTKSDTLGGAQDITVWTKRGVIRLGFFIKSEPAKKFRDWAEEFILSGGGATCTKAPTLPNGGQLKEMHATYPPSICLTIIGRSLNMSDTEIEAMIEENDTYKRKRQSTEIDVKRIRASKTIEPALAEFLCGVTKGDDERMTVDEAYNIYKLQGGKKSKTNFGKDIRLEIGVESFPVKINGQTVRAYNISYEARAEECTGQLD